MQPKRLQNWFLWCNVILIIADALYWWTACCTNTTGHYPNLLWGRWCWAYQRSASLQILVNVDTPIKHFMKKLLFLFPHLICFNLETVLIIYGFNWQHFEVFVLLFKAKSSFYAIKLVSEWIVNTFHAEVILFYWIFWDWYFLEFILLISILAVENRVGNGPNGDAEVEFVHLTMKPIITKSWENWPLVV